MNTDDPRLGGYRPPGHRRDEPCMCFEGCVNARKNWAVGIAGFAIYFALIEFLVQLGGGPWR